MLKLSIYIFIIIFPFFSLLKKQVVYTIGRKKIKRRKVYWVFVAAILSLISISTKTYTDIDIYTNIFDWTNAGTTNFDNIGWALLCRIFYYLGFNYRGMIPFVISFSVWLISRACKRIDIQEEKILSLMLLFPGMMNIIQLKYFLAMSIIIYSITYLQKPDGRSYVFKYVLGIVVATLIHSASIFCIIFLLAIAFEKINTSKTIYYMLASLIVIIVSLKFIPIIASKFLRAEVVSRYFTGAVEISSLNWIVEISISWGLMILVAWLNIKASGIAIKNPIKFKSEGQLFVSRSFTIICLVGVALPLLLYDQNFHRFVEIEYLIGYMIVMYCEDNGNFGNRISKSILAVLLFVSIAYSMRYFVTLDRIFPLFSWDGIVSLRR